MNKFNLTMSIAIVAAIVFFGIGIFQKANYKISEGDSVYVTYSIIDGDDTYDSQSASVTIGSNENKIITDDVLLGAKNNTDLNFETKLKQQVKIDDETTIKKGTEVTIDGTITSVTPGQTTDADSEATSEASSETK